MKRIMIISVVMILTSLTLGFYSKSTFQDKGIISIRNIEDIRQLNCNINQIFTDEDEFGILQEEYVDRILEELSTRTVILRVRPVNYIRQYNFTSSQRVQIIEVIKGNAAADELIELTGSGGGVYDQRYKVSTIDYRNDRPIYSGFINYMLPDNEYLVFVDPLEINEFTGFKRYRIESPFFHVLNLTRDASFPVDRPVNELTYNEFGESEFFCQSDRIRDRALEIKHQIINHYVP